jgi:hypothetical protein
MYVEANALNGIVYLLSGDVQYTRSIASLFTILNKHYTYTLDRNVYDEDDDDDKNDDNDDEEDTDEEEDTESRRTRKIWIMRGRYG